jgi:autotransporter-associated beta strand protein
MKSPIFSCAMVLMLALCALNAVYAGSANWSAAPPSGDWNDPADWMPHVVPNGSSDMARFGTSTQTDVFLSAPVTVSEIIFQTDESSYNVTCSAGTSLTFTGFGIRRNADVTRPPQTFTVAPAESAGGEPGSLIFTNESAGTGVTIINNGGTAPGVAGGTTIFQDTSTPRGATLIANGGTNGGEGGVIQFVDRSTAPKAPVEVDGNGTLLIDSSSSITQVGSISGDGQVVLNNTLYLGAGRGSFSGLISGSGGLIIGPSFSQTLSGANTYSGRTDIRGGGTLIVNNTTGSATSSGDVLVRYGILAGDGIIAGDVTLDSGPQFQFGAPQLSPGTAEFPENDVDTLTLGKKLKFGLRSIYVCLVDGNGGASDLVVANSVSIDPVTATLDLSENGTAPVGMTFTVIQSSGSLPIDGTFMNLPDGGTITEGNNTFQANYEGGDGNDLTLTVVP